MFCVVVLLPGLGWVFNSVVSCLYVLSICCFCV